MGDQVREPTPEERERWLAEADKFRAERAKAEAERRYQEAEAAIAELALERDTEKRAKELAADEHHHVYRFSSAVSESSVKACMERLNQWHRQDEGCAVEIVFTSPGGEIIAGMALWDYLASYKKTHKLTTTALGMAASMAGILLQAGNVRRIGAESWLLIHEASFAAMGSMGDVEDRVEWVKKIQKRILNIFADRSNLSARAIERRWKRKDWWLDSDECLKHGFCDEIV